MSSLSDTSLHEVAHTQAWKSSFTLPATQLISNPSSSLSAAHVIVPQPNTCTEGFKRHQKHSLLLEDPSTAYKATTTTPSTQHPQPHLTPLCPHSCCLALTELREHIKLLRPQTLVLAIPSETPFPALPPFKF